MWELMGELFESVGYIGQVNDQVEGKDDFDSGNQQLMGDQQRMEGRKEATHDNSIMEIRHHDHTVENESTWFDPISSVELANSILLAEKEVAADDIIFGSRSVMAINSVPQKRPRGRPKRIANSFPEPLYVQSTPSERHREAMETWNTAKLLGVRSANEKAVISELRKSKRLLVLEDCNPSG